MRKFLKKVFLFGVAIAALSVLARYALRQDLLIREYTLKSSCVTDSCTFVLLADLHCTEYGAGQRILLDAVAEADPDVVLLAGDMYDEDRRTDEGDALLRALGEAYTCYSASGNHEQCLGRSDDIAAYYSSLGITPLARKSTELTIGANVIRIHGIDDPLLFDDEEVFENALMGFEVSDDAFDVLLSHRPGYAETYAALRFDLTVCGHAHGGQIRIPGILNGFYSPEEGWFPEYAGGQYSFDEGTVIVSRGLMIDEKPRLFNRPELVVIHLEPAE